MYRATLTHLNEDWFSKDEGSRRGTKNPIMTLHHRVVSGRPQGSHFTFSSGQYLLGTGAECQVRPKSEWVSPQHCLLRITPQTASIRDLASRYGTLVNGVRLTQECALKTGDLVAVGPLVFEIEVVIDTIAA